MDATAHAPHPHGPTLFGRFLYWFAATVFGPSIGHPAARAGLDQRDRARPQAMTAAGRQVWRGLFMAGVLPERDAFAREHRA